jgi:hypothetical protein
MRGVIKVERGELNEDTKLTGGETVGSQLATTAGGAAVVSGEGSDTSPTTGSAGGVTIAATPHLRRFHASVGLDPLRLGRDAARIAEEVVQHFSGIVGSDVAVTLDIQVKLPANATEKLIRDVTENCRTLKFDQFGFEES